MKQKHHSRSKKNLSKIIDGHRSAFAAIQEWKLPGELF